MKGKYLCRELEEKDVEAVRNLLESTFSGFLKGRYWDWKYKQNPHFDPSLAIVAEENGEMIGCNHWLLRDFKISGSLKDKAVLAADIVVKPEYRGRGVGKDLMRFLRSSKVVKDKGAAIIYMFADPDSARHFHTPTGGYIPAPDKTVQYLKILNWKKVKQTADYLNDAIKSGEFNRKFSDVDLKVLFKISSAPPLYVNIDGSGIKVDEKETCGSTRADIVISGDLAIFEKIKMGKNRRRNLLKALVIRKLRIGGRLMRFMDFYRNLWIFEELFSRKMT
ncbi:MAG: GNAT family N-acetyltransferase [Candidatus Bathyarchaeota archaeon]|nr:GNAT family N-acetyltransferase [Candidatus Bathyarchaeota archaeon]MDH5787474.1 GNAT family N-acetyltransferase [Candidatus Bathyarchaeota archaeon]